MSKRHAMPKRNNKSKRQKKMIQTNQVRIIGGRFKRRQVDFINLDGLRPTPDRLRETLFNWITPYLHGAIVLDSCAGSGVLGFEAISRGAAHVTFIEADVEQANLLQTTAKRLELTDDTSTIIHAKAEQVLSTSTADGYLPNHLAKPLSKPPIISDSSLKSDATLKNDKLTILESNPESNKVFSIVFIDPPYSLKLCPVIIEGLTKACLIDKDTLVYIEDNQSIEDTLQTLEVDYDILKSANVGQVTGSIIQINNKAL